MSKKVIFPIKFPFIVPNKFGKFPAQRGEKLCVDETVGLQEGTSDHLGNFCLLNVHLIDQSPDQFYGPGCPSLGVAHDENIVVSQLEIGNPLTRLGDSIIPLKAPSTPHYFIKVLVLEPDPSFVKINIVEHIISGEPKSASGPTVVPQRSGASEGQSCCVSGDH